MSGPQPAEPKSGTAAEEKRHLLSLYGWVAALLSPAGPEDPSTVLVCLVLAAHMSSVGASCFPSIDTIALESRLSRRAVIKHLKLAIRAGWIKKASRMMAGGRHSSNLYTALIPAAAMVHQVHHSIVHQVHPWVHQTAVDSAPGAPPSNYALTTQGTESAPAKRRARAGKTMLPKDWGPDEATWRWLREHNVAEIDAKAMLELFIEHARAGGRLQLDWNASFRVWVMREKKTAFRSGPAPLPTTPKADATCCWTAGGQEPRCGEPGQVHYGGGRYLCAAHAGEYSRLKERGERHPH